MIVTGRAGRTVATRTMTASVGTVTVIARTRRKKNERSAKGGIITRMRPKRRERIGGGGGKNVKRVTGSLKAVKGRVMSLAIGP